MSNPKWDDHDIQQLLKTLPQQKDHRTKDQFFQQLQQKMEYKDPNTRNVIQSLPPKKRFYQGKLKIASVLVATFILVVFIPITLLLLNREQNNETVETSHDDVQAEINSLQEKEQVDHNISMYNTPSSKIMDLRKGLYEDEISNEEILYIGFAGDAAESVPAAIKIPSSWLNANNLDQNFTYLELYKKSIESVQDELLGFQDYHPLVGRLEEQGKKLLHYLPENHPYDIGTASTSNYLGVMEDTFGHHYDELVVLNEDGTPITFEHIGEISEPFQLKSPTNVAYFLFNSSNGNSYLSTNFRETYVSIDDAVVALADTSNDIYQSPLIKEVAFDYEVKENELIITFKEQLDVTLYQEDLLMTMFEALIFTAESFDLSIRFENIKQSSWGGFDLTKTIPQPLSVNEQILAF